MRVWGAFHLSRHSDDAGLVVMMMMMMAMMVRGVVAIVTMERIGNIANGASTGDRPWL